MLCEFKDSFRRRLISPNCARTCRMQGQALAVFTDEARDQRNMQRGLAALPGSGRRGLGHCQFIDLIER